MRVLITGTSNGIGLATAKLFLDKGHTVYGLDIEDKKLVYSNFFHHTCDVSNKDELPDIDDLDIVINNAGVQGEEGSISVNLLGYINVGEKYACQKNIKSVVNVGSISAHSGIELPLYCASNGGRLAYTKNLALRLSKYGATVNSVSPGGVKTKINADIMSDTTLMEEVLNETLLKKWAEPEEVAELIYFLTVVNKSITGQDIIIDNGEFANYNFVATDEVKKLL